MSQLNGRSVVELTELVETDAEEEEEEKRRASVTGKKRK